MTGHPSPTIAYVIYWSTEKRPPWRSLFCFRFHSAPCREAGRNGGGDWMELQTISKSGLWKVTEDWEFWLVKSGNLTSKMQTLNKILYVYTDGTGVLLCRMHIYYGIRTFHWKPFSTNWSIENEVQLWYLCCIQTKQPHTFVRLQWGRSQDLRKTHAEYL